MPVSTANYLSTDAAGGVTADFTGHIHADGLDLDAATSATPPDDSKVRWILQSDGSVVADIGAFRTGGSPDWPALRLHVAGDPSPAQDTTVYIGAGSPSIDAAIELLLPGITGGMSGGQRRLLGESVDGNGSSDYNMHYSIFQSQGGAGPVLFNGMYLQLGTIATQAVPPGIMNFGTISYKNLDGSNRSVSGTQVLCLGTISEAAAGNSAACGFSIQKTTFTQATVIIRNPTGGAINCAFDYCVVHFVN